jgi:hypothetical protein
VQNLVKPPEYLFSDVAAVVLFREWKPIDENGAADAQNAVSIVYGAAIEGVALVGISSADTHPICR